MLRWARFDTTPRSVQRVNKEEEQGIETRQDKTRQITAQHSFQGFRAHHTDTDTQTHLDVIPPVPHVPAQVVVVRGGGHVPRQGPHGAEEADEAQQPHDPPHLHVRALLQPRRLVGWLVLFVFLCFCVFVGGFWSRGSIPFMVCKQFVFLRRSEHHEWTVLCERTGGRETGGTQGGSVGGAAAFRMALPHLTLNSWRLCMGPFNPLKDTKQ